MYLNLIMFYVLSAVAVELLFCVLILIFSNEVGDWMARLLIGTQIDKSWCKIKEDKIKLFVSNSTTKCWTSEYAIVVVLQRNRTHTTRIIDMSYLHQDIKTMFRKYENEYLHMSLNNSQQELSASVKIDGEEITDETKIASVVLSLLQSSVSTDLHKIPSNGVRISYITLQPY